MNKLRFLTISIPTLAAGASLVFLCPVEVAVRILLAVLLVLGFTKAIYYTQTGRYFLSIARGLFWGVQLKSFPIKFRCDDQVLIFHPRRVSFGRSCNVGKGAVLCPVGGEHPSRIVIGNRVHIGAMDRIASMNEVVIEDDVLFAAFVHITDHSHEYRQAGVPVKQQGIFSNGPVRIKKGAWLAFGCQILPGVTVGEYSVVAANSVVTRDVPPYTVVAGVPARPVSRFDHQSGQWVKVKDE